MLKDQHTMPDVKMERGERRPGCAVTVQAGPGHTGKANMSRVIARGTLIIRDGPGSMMGNKLSVIPQQEGLAGITGRARGCGPGRPRRPPAAVT